MQEKLKQIAAAANAETIVDKNTLEAFRIKYLGTKGIMKEVFEAFKQVPNEEKKSLGQLINVLKNELETLYTSKKEALENISDQATIQDDFTKPGIKVPQGNRHPINIIKNDMIAIFERIGFTIAEGPEIEDEWHNFTALNTPEDHPARDMQDTFYIDSSTLLRTHTSPVQIRVMETQTPPIRIITPGRVYRNETISARAHCTFHQVEGLYINKNVSFADLKQTLLYFAKEMFGQNVDIRLRPSYFPFTEPSAELDISCFICDRKGCAVCKGSGWVEIGGCGMVDPAVLENCKIDASQFTGFAFGMGIERITMLKYGIDDIRLFYENDIRFLKQFA
ncbi:MAG: phenylalanine--tRNA ligase subunit alpha [Bacteroidota bacterium]